jgi:hypothetical protein
MKSPKTGMYARQDSTLNEDRKIKRKTQKPTKNMKIALDLCHVIDKRKKGEISKANFDKIAKMCGFIGPDRENASSEAKF